MDKNEIRKQIADLKLIVKNAQIHIETVQLYCKHEEEKLSPIGESSPTICKVCADCEKVIGYPTEKELKDAAYKE